MGLEAYLFQVKFITPIPEAEIKSCLEQIGLTFLPDKFKQRTPETYGAYHFELRTDKGLTEVHCLLASEDTHLSRFSLRFSVVSPKSVIDQTFHLLDKLNQTHPIRVKDTEIINHLYRQLRMEEKVDNSFRGIEGTDLADEIEQKGYIDLDVEAFKRNEWGIKKREIVLNNQDGAIIEGGSTTIRHIEEKGLVQRFFGWITKEI